MFFNEKLLLLIALILEVEECCLNFFLCAYGKFISDASISCLLQILITLDISSSISHSSFLVITFLVSLISDKTFKIFYF